MSDIVSLFAGLNAEQGDLVTARFGAVQWVIFNRPQARNAMTFAMYDRLVELCAEVNADSAVRVMVLTGAGGAFVAGTDISQFRTFETEQDALDYDARGGNVMDTLEKVRVPTIAAIAGPCTGGGAGLAGCCDLRVASPSARYGFPIARTLGNTLSVANYARLTALLGVARLKDIIMTARLMDAPEMLSTGLVREVVATRGRVAAHRPGFGGPDSLARPADAPGIQGSHPPGAQRNPLSGRGRRTAAGLLHVQRLQRRCRSLHGEA